MCGRKVITLHFRLYLYLTIFRYRTRLEKEQVTPRLYSHHERRSTLAANEALACRKRVIGSPFVAWGVSNADILSQL